MDEIQVDLEFAAQLHAKAFNFGPTLKMACHKQLEIEEVRRRREEEQEMPAREVEDSLFLRVESAPAHQAMVRSDAFQRVSSAGDGQVNTEEDERANLRALVPTTRARTTT